MRISSSRTVLDRAMHIVARVPSNRRERRRRRFGHPPGDEKERASFIAEVRGMPESMIYQRLTEILQDVFDDDELTAVPEMTADDVDGWDSLAHLRLIAAVEKKFSVRFAASQISGLQNVGELATLIESKIQSAIP